MKTPKFFPFASRLMMVPLLAAACCLLGARVEAQKHESDGPQRRFASPEEATQTLRDAAKAGDHAAMHEIFGPDIHKFLTGDEVQDHDNFLAFSRAMAEACTTEAEGVDRVVLVIGTNKWPFPIPLVKQEGQWRFDTDAGREEIINRHIGGDELHAIGVCRAYVEAQRQYHSKDHDGSGVMKYALKFKSTPGKQDGLYWKSMDGPSPFAALVAEAHAEGYGDKSKHEGPHPFHGYFFRVLTRQGKAAPGGKADYLDKGNLTGGFALVAYPENWGKSGIMTFIVNQDGTVYQRDFGAKTGRVAPKIAEYNPEAGWTPVTETGTYER